MWGRLLLMCWFASMVSSESGQGPSCQDICNDNINEATVKIHGSFKNHDEMNLSGLHQITCFKIYTGNGNGINLNDLCIGNGLESNDFGKNCNIIESTTEGSCHCLKCETPLLAHYVTVDLPNEYKMEMYSQKLESPKMELVKEEKTWNNAVDHCRDRNMELVAILDAEKQAWVELELSKATTESVWLGLRYTCTLDFWFWVSDHRLDFENWAQNNKENGCSMSAAMKTKEDYRWVKMNEDEKFNFICE